jgi:serine phosphatase RsbU (regulator of sigma subunit)
LYLSGDFLEYIRFGEDFLGFYIADVSGHGVASALVTTLLRHLSLQVHRETREAALHGRPTPFPTPADALAFYNSELLSAKIDKHVTIFMALLDKKDNVLTYSVAGHLPMPILATDDGVRYLEGSGMPIGLVHDAKYENFTIALPERFTLALCSDGVFEIVPAKTLIEKEALLLQLIADSDRTQQGIEKQLQLDTVSDVPDDIAVMTLVKTA